MKTNTSKRSILLRSLILLPILWITLYSFSNKTVVEKEVSIASNTILLNDIVTITESQSERNNASEGLMAEYRTFITEYKNTNTIWNGKYQRAIVIYYNLMSDKQRASVSEPPKNILDYGGLAKVKHKTPTEGVFNSWKSKNNYALWLDGKVIDNSELNNLSFNDIEYYTDSFIHKNARSDKFLQTHQVNIFTKNGFNETYKKANVNAYNELSKTYSKQISKFLKGNRLDNSELKILYFQGETLYKNISKYNIETYNIKPFAPVPAQKKSQKSQKNNINKPQSKLSQKQLKTNKKPTPAEYYAGVRFIVYNKSTQYRDTIIGEEPVINKLYEDLTENDKKEFILLDYSPTRLQKKTPTKEEMEEVRDPKVFLVHIDNEIVANSELEKYKPEDFARYSGRMFIHKTGRKKHPQPFWAIFYTHKYYEEKEMGKYEMKYGTGISECFKNVKTINKKFSDK